MKPLAVDIGNYTSPMAIFSYASGDLAEKINDKRREISRSLNGSVAHGLQRAIILEEAFRVYVDNQVEGWDGHGGVPVDFETYQMTCGIINALPNHLQPTSVSVDPDGQMTLEWYKNVSRLLSVSISPNGEMHYASAVGARKYYGTEFFLGEMPEEILRIIFKIYKE